MCLVLGASWEVMGTRWGPWASPAWSGSLGTARHSGSCTSAFTTAGEFRSASQSSEPASRRRGQAGRALLRETEPQPPSPRGPAQHSPGGHYQWNAGWGPGPPDPVLERSVLWHGMARWCRLRWPVAGGPALLDRGGRCWLGISECGVPAPRCPIPAEGESPSCLRPPRLPPAGQTEVRMDTQADSASCSAGAGGVSPGGQFAPLDLPRCGRCGRSGARDAARGGLADPAGPSRTGPGQQAARRREMKCHPRSGSCLPRGACVRAGRRPAPM